MRFMRTPPGLATEEDVRRWCNARLQQVVELVTSFRDHYWHDRVVDQACRSLESRAMESVPTEYRPAGEVILRCGGATSR